MKIYKVAIIILIITEVIFFHLSYKSFKNENNSYEIKKTSYEGKEPINTSNKMFAYFIDDGTGNFQENNDRTSWPNAEEYAYLKSECYDGDGNKLNASEVVTFDGSTFKATVNTSTTIYCYMYFAKIDTPLGLVVRNSGSAGTKSFEESEKVEARDTALKSAGVAEEDLDSLRRFVGDYTKVTDNFVCFGTKDQDTCLQNKDKYMYRIIGIDKNDRVKLIKATKIYDGSKGTIRWHNTAGVEWDASDLFLGLNGQINQPNKKYFIGSTDFPYMSDTNWTNLIATDITWYKGSGVDSSSTGEDFYKQERQLSFSGSETAKIGLMYVSDYYYASNGDFKNGWLLVQFGVTTNTLTETMGHKLANPLAESEWTMVTHDTAEAWFVYPPKGMRVYSFAEGGTVVARPVFYLKNTVKFTNAKGIESDPYMIVNTAVS